MVSNYTNTVQLPKSHQNQNSKTIKTCFFSFLSFDKTQNQSIFLFTTHFLRNIHYFVIYLLFLGNHLFLVLPFQLQDLIIFNLDLLSFGHLLQHHRHIQRSSIWLVLTSASIFH